MPYTLKKNPSKFLPKIVAISPYELYLNQVKATVDTIRAQRKGMSYFPPQMGGISGQRKIIEQGIVLQLIDFEVN